jgi:hypothetical protein
MYPATFVRGPTLAISGLCSLLRLLRSFREELSLMTVRAIQHAGEHLARI